MYNLDHCEKDLSDFLLFYSYPNVIKLYFKVVYNVVIHLNHRFTIHFIKHLVKIITINYFLG